MAETAAASTHVARLKSTVTRATVHLLPSCTRAVNRRRPWRFCPARAHHPIQSSHDSRMSHLHNNSNNNSNNNMQ